MGVYSVLLIIIHNFKFDKIPYTWCTGKISLPERVFNVHCSWPVQRPTDQARSRIPDGLQGSTIKPVLPVPFIDRPHVCVCSTQDTGPMLSVGIIYVDKGVLSCTF